MIIALILGVIMWRRESAVQDAVLYLLAGIGGGVVLVVAFIAELSSKDASSFEIALVTTGIIIFSAATISGLRQLKALRNKK